jgi:hypothetical protein
MRPQQRLEGHFPRHSGATETLEKSRMSRALAA